jgi:PAS domain S-box-containing protein
VAGQRQAECQYRAIFDGTGDGILVVDLETGLIIDANPAISRMSGYSYDELIGMDPVTIVHPNSRKVFEERVKGREMESFDDRVALVGVHRDGSPRNVEVQVQTVDLGGTLARLSVVRDVTERVHALELLEQRVVERTREVSAILEVTHAVNATLELAPLVELVLDRLGSIVEYTDAALMLLDGDDLCISDYRGRSAREQMVGRRIPATSAVVFQAVVRANGVVIVDNLQSEDEVAIAYRQWQEREPFAPWSEPRSVLAVPLRVKGEIIGQLRLDHEQTHFYRQRHADLALAFANQVATAIVNARLFEAERQSRESEHTAIEAKAVLEERQKLARELHDSVSQSLYGIGTAAQTARSALRDDHDVEVTAQALDYVVLMADVGLAEMRALISELRPEPLAQEGLVSALERHLDLLLARHQVSIEAHLDDEPELPLAAKEALYRIAREALHNTIKHARARRASVSLKAVEDGYVLEVVDDGVGFDTAAEYPGHLGLASMAERARAAGGRLSIESAAGRGTRVTVQIPRDGYSEANSRV